MFENLTIAEMFIGVRTRRIMFAKLTNIRRVSNSATGFMHNIRSASKR